MLKLFVGSRCTQEIFSALKGEHTRPLWGSVKGIVNCPTILLKFLSLMLWLGRSHRAKKGFDGLISGVNLSLEEFYICVRKLEEYKSLFISIYEEHGFDAIISPAAPFPAWPHDMGQELLGAMDYNLIFNFFDFPVGIIPIRKSEKSSYEYDDGINDAITRSIKKVLKNCGNLPVGIQVITLPNRDENCLAMMDIIDSVLRRENVIQDYVDFNK